MLLLKKLLHWTGLRICGENMDHEWRKDIDHCTFTTDHYDCMVCNDHADEPSGFSPHVRR